MTKAAARKGDKCTGHPGAGPRVNDQGSPDVFINGKAVHRVGDHWIKHSGHDSLLAQGSPTVFANGKAQGRVGDRIACGSRVATGSPDVFIGDAPTVLAPIESKEGSPIPEISSSRAPRGLQTAWDRIRGRSGGGGYDVYDEDGNIIASDDGADEELPPVNLDGKHLIWGKARNVSPAFRARVFAMAVQLGMPEQEGANWLMAVMAYETVESFSPSIKNPKSSATGLIQFMRDTAIGLGTSTAALSRLSPEAQLEWVYKYFRPYRGRMSKLEDVYLAVFTPAAMGKPVGHVLYRRGQSQYRANIGFDTNRDGTITVGEISREVRAKFVKGQGARYIWVQGQG